MILCLNPISDSPISEKDIQKTRNFNVPSKILFKHFEDEHARTKKKFLCFSKRLTQTVAY